MAGVHIILTGASSFTGFWFAKTLVSRNATVIATLSNPDLSAGYRGVRAERVSRLKELCRTEFAASFGSTNFFDLIRREPRIDILCHHWSHVHNYKSEDFDAVAALAENTRGFRDLLRLLKDKGCGRIVLTGSVGEPGEGAGSQPPRAFNPYSLSKRLTYEFAQYYCEREGMTLDKFVIPNPFGPFEDPRFTYYLISSWFAGQIPVVETPLYVRDNIHVDLLSLAYATFLLDTAPITHSKSCRLAPSGYVETQGAFAARVARELSGRLNMPCHIEYRTQKEFREPAVRINTDRVDIHSVGWNENGAWDAFAAYYASLRKLRTR